MNVRFLGDTMEEQFWTFIIEMSFLGFGLFAGTMMGMGMADLNPDSK